MYLGWSEGFHDAAVAVIDDKGNIKFATHAERFSNHKHDKHVGPSLKRYIESNYDITHKAFYEKPFLKRTRQLYAGQVKTAFSKRKMAWKPDSTYPHHMSHAAATFQTSPYEEAVAIVVDSIGEWDTTTIWKCKYDTDGNAVYKKVYCRVYPQSIGLWYTALTKYVGLRPLDEEYIFMGMAAYGKYNPVLKKYLHAMLTVVDPEYPDERDANLHRGVNYIQDKFLSSFTGQDIAFNAQMVLEEELVYLFKEASVHSRNFVYGGGVALNCVANSVLSKLCKGRLWIMPNPGDAGGALGAACLAYGRKVKFDTPYLGLQLNSSSDKENLAERVVNELLDKGICGLAYGRAEWGPRALGNRSLLADPRGPDAQDRVNTIKKRQKFRPFAPVILEEFREQYFKMSQKSPYMQFTFDCIRGDELPAIVHADNSSRVQTIRADEKGTIMGLVLKKWYEKTGCPVLLNTSLNVRGKPMVNDVADAFEFTNNYHVPVFF
jgi:carbamoyltransferase